MSPKCQKKAVSPPSAVKCSNSWKVSSDFSLPKSPKTAMLKLPVTLGAVVKEPTTELSDPIVYYYLQLCSRSLNVT